MSQTTGSHAQRSSDRKAAEVTVVLGYGPGLQQIFCANNYKE